MAKQHTVSLARKRELEQPDEFIIYTNKLLDFLISNKYLIAAVAGTVFAAIFLFAGIQYVRERSELKAADGLHQVIAKYEQNLKKDGAVKAVEAVESDFKNFFNEYAGTAAGKVARLKYANIYYDAADFDKAIAAYKLALEGFQDHPDIKNLILCDLGYAYEAKNDNTNAIIYFEQITQGGSKLKKDEALYHLGRLRKESGDTASANKAYDQLISEFPNSDYVERVKELRIR